MFASAEVERCKVSRIFKTGKSKIKEALYNKIIKLNSFNWEPQID